MATRLLVFRVLTVLLGIMTLCAGADSKSVEFPANRRARAVVVQNSDSITTFSTHDEVVQAMVARGVTNLTSQGTVSEAWRSLVSTNDKIGIKVFSTPGAISGTRPAVVAAVVQQLIAAGVPAKQIIIWDKRMIDLHLAGFAELATRLGVQIGATTESGYDDKFFYEHSLLGKLIWGDHEFGKKGEGIGRKSFVSKLVTQEMTKIIHITPLLSHNTAGVSGNLYDLTMASVDNTIRFDADPGALAVAVPEIYALPIMGDRVVLNIVDALICQYEGEQRGLLHYSTVLGELRFSTDPVALDMLSLRDINNYRKAAGTNTLKATLEIYSNASMLEIGQNDLKKIFVERLK